MKRDKDRCLTLLRVAEKRDYFAWTPPERATLMVREWGRVRDLDNVCASIKYLIDAIVTEGYLSDDNPKCLVAIRLASPTARPSWLPKTGPGVELILRRVM